MEVLIVLLFIALLTPLVRRSFSGPPGPSATECLRRADHVLAAEQRRARRAMNDAAGQSWRNMID